MPTQISDLWVPDIWVQAMREKQATFPSLFNSGIVAKNPIMDELATGAGTTVNVPFFKDITDQADEIQVENTAPVNDNNQPGSKMVGAVCNRVTQTSASALSAQVSGADPVDAIVSQLVMRRLKQRQTTLVAMLRAIMGTGSVAANTAAPLAANRYGGTTSEIFLETATTNAANLVSPTVFIQAKALMGELQDELKDGCFLCHPNIKAALEVQDALNFKSLKMPSELPWTITTYRDIPIFTSMALSRAGTTSGTVYDSYLLGPGAFGYGEKAQAGDVLDVASLQYWVDRFKNNSFFFDRTRFVLHPLGMKWVGTAAGQSPTNAELGTIANWNLGWTSANRVPITAFRTNG